MAFFNWSDSFSVGVEEFDEQHKKLIAMLNGLYDAMKEGRAVEALGPLLSDLIAYTRTHFANEERLLAEKGYPDFEGHKQEHDKLTQRVLELETQFKLGKAAISLDTGKFLKEWLQNHIQGSDKKYGIYLNSIGLR